MEKRLIRLFCIPVLLLLLTSCNITDKKKNICNTNIRDIEVFYYSQLFIRDVAVNCDDLLKEARECKVGVNDVMFFPVIDTLIMDCFIIEQIEYEIKKFQPGARENRLIDARILVHINYKNGEVDEICISGYFGQDVIYNGQLQYNNKFLYLIKLYSGFYQWIGVDYMKYFDELNDPSFKREKVKSRWGGEY